MRWPFGPPHLTLKPSKKNKQKNNKKTKKTKKNKKNKKINNNNNSQPQNQEQSKQDRNKNKTKQTKTNTRNTKTPKPSKPRWTTMSHPRKKPQKLGKTNIFNTFETIQDTPKTNLLTLKPYNKQTQKKHHFSMFKNNPLFFINFLFFSTYSFCFWKAVFCWTHYKNSVFRKTQLFKNTVSKTHFFNHVKKHLFPKKRCHFCFFCNIRWTPYFYSVLCFTLFWSKKKNLAKTDSCNENARFSFPFLTQIVSGNFC